MRQRYGRLLVETILGELGIEVTREHNGWFLALCPLHDDRDPSLTICAEEGGWKCFAGCGSSGDLADLVAAITGESPRDARRRLRLAMPAENFDLDAFLLEPQDGSASEVAPEPLFYDSAHVPKYMVRRGFTLATLRAWGVGWDAAERAVVIPVRSNGVVVGLIRRRLAGEPKYRYSRGLDKSKIVFGMDMIPAGAREAAVVEGPLDAMWLWQCGIPAVAVLGASMSLDQAEAISRRFYSVLLAFDADSAGQRAARQAARMLWRLRVRVVRLPPGRKDVQECSADEIAMAVAGAVDVFAV